MWCGIAVACLRAAQGHAVVPGLAYGRLSRVQGGTSVGTQLWGGLGMVRWLPGHRARRWYACGAFLGARWAALKGAARAARLFGQAGGWACANVTAVCMLFGFLIHTLFLWCDCIPYTHHTDVCGLKP